jgi:hypothetical protein
VLGDYHSTGMEDLAVGMTRIPTPAALASGRQGPTAPAKLSVVPEPSPSEPIGIVTTHLDVLASDRNGSEEPANELSLDIVLDLPDALKILLVTYTYENDISISRFIRERLAAFFMDDPPTPKKERHLKLVK